MTSATKSSGSGDSSSSAATAPPASRTAVIDSPARSVRNGSPRPETQRSNSAWRAPPSARGAMTAAICACVDVNSAETVVVVEPGPSASGATAPTVPSNECT